MRRPFRAWRLQLYVLVEFLKALALAAGVFTGLFLLMTSLGMGRLSERHGLEAGAMLLALPYLLPYILCFAVPLAFLVAGVLAFGRLEGAGEICAMRAAGASLWSIAAWPLGAALVASGLLLLLADRGVEWGFARASEIVLESGRASLLRRAGRSHTIKVDLPDRALRIHRFAEGPGGEASLAVIEFAGGAPRDVVLARDHELDLAAPDARGALDSERLRFVMRPGSGPFGWARILGPGEVVLGESGTLDVVVEHPPEDRGAARTGPEGGAWRQKTLPWGGREYAIGVSGNLREAHELRARLGALEREELDAALRLAAISLAGGAPSEETARRLEEAEVSLARAREAIERTSRRLRVQRMELHRKLSMAAGSVALALLGMPLGLRLARGGRLAGFAAGVAAIAVLYYPLWMSGQGLAVSGVLPAGPAVWAADAVAGAAGIAWLRRLA